MIHCFCLFLWEKINLLLQKFLLLELARCCSFCIWFPIIFQLNRPFFPSDCSPLLCSYPYFLLLRQRRFKKCSFFISLPCIWTGKTQIVPPPTPSVLCVVTFPAPNHLGAAAAHMHMGEGGGPPRRQHQLQPDCPAAVRSGVASSAPWAALPACPLPPETRGNDRFAGRQRLLFPVPQCKLQFSTNGQENTTAG